MLSPFVFSSPHISHQHYGPLLRVPFRFSFSAFTGIGVQKQHSFTANVCLKCIFKISFQLYNSWIYYPCTNNEALKKVLNYHTQSQTLPIGFHLSFWHLSYHKISSQIFPFICMHMYLYIIFLWIYFLHNWYYI